MKCAHCHHLDTTTHEKHWALGLGACHVIGPERTEGGKATIFVHILHEGECAKFEQADEAVIESRRQEWVKRKSNKGDR